MKDLTVFILTHNRGEMLLETIDSVLNQTCHDFKFVISDNSSNDETACLLKERNLLGKFEYRKRDREYPGLEHFNICLSEVGTQYFVLFHDDDIMLPDYVETMYNAINGSEYVAVGCNAYKLLDTHRTKKIFWRENRVGDIVLDAKGLAEQYCKKNIVPYPSYVYSKGLIGTLKFDDECGKYSDVSWLFRLTHIASILWISTPQMYYRIHSGQDSQSYDYDNQKKLFGLFRVTLGKSNKYLKKYECDLLYSKIIVNFKKSRKVSYSEMSELFKKSFSIFLKSLVKITMVKFHA